MYFTQRSGLDAEAEKVLKLWRGLDENQRGCLLAFAEFLSGRAKSAGPGGEAATAEEPVEVAAAPNETVVGAIKRLSASYPMLDKKRLLTETASQMSRHLMQGAAKTDVIEELETIFRHHYEAYRSNLRK